MDTHDIYTIGISGGKDSTALLLWAVHESGYPHEKLRVTFCDTGNESQITYDYIKYLSDNIFNIETITPPMGFYELAKKRGRFPSPKRRFCTQELKIFPTQSYIKQFQNDNKSVCILTGVRANESEDRSKLQEFDFDLFYACDIYRPLLKWTIDDVWAIHKRYGIYRNPLYDIGAKRVGCYPCIMSSKMELRELAKRSPDRIDFLRDKETEIGRTFFSANKVPAHCSSKQALKNSEVVYVPTIDDVVTWSMTAYGGKQFEFDFDEGLMCDSNLGMCE